MTDWGNPETLWLNVTNAALGLICLACVALVVVAVVREVAARARRREAVEGDAHTYAVPQLGLTMADGGEPVDESQKK